MKKVGLITYHSAYNFGSALQTYATVKSLENLGYEVETIDYRTPSQTEWYNVDFSPKKGLRHIKNNYKYLFIKKERATRRAKYEEFIAKFLRPSAERFISYDEIKSAEFDYDYLISGSDQIWNFKCGEFRHESHDAILPYFLQFGQPKKRIAFSSSFGNQSLRQIRKYKELLMNYDALSTREPIGKRWICRAIDKDDVKLVCDPTWLLDKKQWMSIEGVYKPSIKKNYILVYLLEWHPSTIDHWMAFIKKLAARNDMDVVVITPLNYYENKNVMVLQDAGPLDFLSYMGNASLVITSTFHGTMFPVNFEIPFYCCKAQPASRQGQILELCGLEDRIIHTPDELLEDEDFCCDFSKSSIFVSELRSESLLFLKEALI